MYIGHCTYRVSITLYTLYLMKCMQYYANFVKKAACVVSRKLIKQNQ